MPKTQLGWVFFLFSRSLIYVWKLKIDLKQQATPSALFYVAIPGLALKNPPKKPNQKNPKKHTQKNPLKTGFFGFFWVF